MVRWRQGSKVFGSEAHIKPVPRDVRCARLRRERKPDGKPIQLSGSFESPAVEAAVATDGAELWRCELPAPAVPDGLLVDRGGRIMVTLRNGCVFCFSGE
jgi:hypothetical protein